MALRYDKKIRTAILRHIKSAGKQGKTLVGIAELLNSLGYVRPNGTVFNKAAVATFLQTSKLSILRLRKGQRRRNAAVATSRTSRNAKPTTSVPTFVRELLRTDRVSADWKISALKEFWSV